MCVLTSAVYKGDCCQHAPRMRTGCRCYKALFHPGTPYTVYVWLSILPRTTRYGSRHEFCRAVQKCHASDEHSATILNVILLLRGLATAWES